VSAKLEVLPDGAAAARRGAELIAAAGSAAAGERGAFSLAMSGGSSPPTWAMLATLGELEEMPWGETELFQVDERIASPGSEERNLTHLVLGLSIEHQASLRPMPVTQRDLEAAAREYESSSASAPTATPPPWSPRTRCSRSRTGASR
jgi:6-phosphogluconolactonase